MNDGGPDKVKPIQITATKSRSDLVWWRSFYMAAITLIILLAFPAGAAQSLKLKNDDITVVYEPPLESVAGEIVRLYPELRQELQDMFGWSLDVRPQVVLVKNNQDFQKIARNKRFVAFAVPDKNLIVIDYSRMNVHPFSLRTTLKHELCHLLLHRQIDNRNLPKWLDEGICQWASDGIGEIFVNKGWSGLDAAVMAGRIIPFDRLTDYFPREESSLILAYEQSKSVINYVDRQYGHHVIMALLNDLKNGETVKAALMNSLALSPDQLENEWLDHLQSTPRWLVFLANNIYGILFFLAAVLTFLGFIRLLRHRKKVYREWEEDDEEW
jgi:hypothetical protein